MPNSESLLRSAQTTELTIASPAAGADWTQTIPAGQCWRIESLSFNFVTSATVANRVPRLLITDAAGNAVFRGGLTDNIAASSTVWYSYVRGSGYQTPTTKLGGLPNIAVLPDIWLPAGYIVKMSTASIDVADQYSAIAGIVLESTDT